MDRAAQDAEGGHTYAASTYIGTFTNSFLQDIGPSRQQLAPREGVNRGAMMQLVNHVSSSNALASCSCGAYF